MKYTEVLLRFTSFLTIPTIIDERRRVVTIWKKKKKKETETEREEEKRKWGEIRKISIKGR